MVQLLLRKKQKTSEENIRICRLCDKDINIKKEAWALLIDYMGEIKTEEGAYHKKCLNDVIKGNMQQMREQVMGKIGEMAGKYMQAIKRGMNDDGGEPIKTIKFD